MRQVIRLIGGVVILAIFGEVLGETREKALDDLHYGIQLRLTDRGLTQWLQTALTHSLPDKPVRLNDLSGEIPLLGAAFTYKLSQANLKRLKCDIANSRIYFDATDGLVVAVTGIAVSLSAEYSAALPLMSFARKSGKVSISAAGGDVTLDLGLFNNHGRIGIKNTGCDAKIGEFNLELGSDALLDTVFNSFIGMVKDGIKDAVAKSVCSYLENVAAPQITDFLWNIPQKFQPQGWPLSFGISLLRDPKASKDGYIELQAKTAFYLGQQQIGGGKPEYPGKGLPAKPKTMAELLLTETFFNGVAEVIHRTGIFDFAISKKMVAPLGMGEFMDVLCADTCIGNAALEGIVKKFPKSTHFQIQLRTKEAPKTVLGQTGVVFLFQIETSFVLFNQNEQLDEAFAGLLQLHIALTNIKLTPAKSGDGFELTSAVESQNFLHEIQRSNVGSVQSVQLEAIVQFLFIATVDGLLNRVLADGIYIPQPPQVYLNPNSISLGTSLQGLSFGADIDFTGKGTLDSWLRSFAQKLEERISAAISEQTQLYTSAAADAKAHEAAQRAAAESAEQGATAGIYEAELNDEHAIPEPPLPDPDEGTAPLRAEVPVAADIHHHPEAFSPHETPSEFPPDQAEQQVVYEQVDGVLHGRGDGIPEVVQFQETVVQQQAEDPGLELPILDAHGSPVELQEQLAQVLEGGSDSLEQLAQLEKQFSSILGENAAQEALVMHMMKEALGRGEQGGGDEAVPEGSEGEGDDRRLPEAEAERQERLMAEDLIRAAMRAALPPGVVDPELGLDGEPHVHDETVTLPEGLPEAKRSAVPVAQDHVQT